MPGSLSIGLDNVCTPEQLATSMPPDTMGGQAGALTLQAILDRAPE